MADFKVQSMTGYGRSQGESDAGKWIVELRSVNNRFQDISQSLPRELGGLESQLRRALKDAVPRGKIDCRVRFFPAAAAQGRVAINVEAARAYVEELGKLTEAGVRGEPTLEVISRLPGVIEMQTTELDENKLWEGDLKPLVIEAIEKLNADRSREGRELAVQLSALIGEIRGGRDAVFALKDDVVARYRQRLGERLKQIESETSGRFEPGRLEAEVAQYADRADICEELTRLDVHLDHFDKLLVKNDGMIGKNLDFLVQEIFREVNTICSKSRETDLTQAGLAMKSAVEKIREQIQNIQ